MPDKQIAFRVQAAIELFHQPLLLRFVKIDHHVAAEDHVIALRQKLRFQIMKVEMDQVFQPSLDCVSVAHLVEIAQAVA